MTTTDTTTDPTTDPTTDTPAELRRALGGVRGDVLAGGDPRARDAVAPFNVVTYHDPDVVVVAADADDVAAAVRAAADTGRRVAVQATGHGAAAARAGDVLVSTRRLDAVAVDADARTAVVGAGATWQQVLDAAAPAGLVPLTGSAPGVGAVGYTLGGGLGPMARTFGLTCDRVRSLDVVTADGEQVHVDAASDPERFWALRGGGAAFGLVTAMTVDLVPLRTFYGGGLWFSADVARTVLHRWREWAQDLPETVTTSVARLALPPVPGVPVELAGRDLVHVRVAAVTGASQGERLVAPLRRAAPLLLDGVTELPAAAVGAVHADPTDPMPVAERSALLREVPPAAVDAFCDASGPGSGVFMTELRLVGGAVSRRPEVPSAAAGRDAAASLLAIGVAVPMTADTLPGALEGVLARLAPWQTGGALLNFSGAAAPETAARVRSGYGAAWEPLVALRELTDPRGVLDGASRWARPTR